MAAKRNSLLLSPSISLDRGAPQGADDTEAQAVLDTLKAYHGHACTTVEGMGASNQFESSQHARAAHVRFCAIFLLQCDAVLPTMPHVASARAAALNTLLIHSLALATIPFLPTDRQRQKFELELRTAVNGLGVSLPEKSLLEYSIDPITGRLKPWGFMLQSDTSTRAANCGAGKLAR